MPLTMRPTGLGDGYDKDAIDYVDWRADVELT